MTVCERSRRARHPAAPLSAVPVTHSPQRAENIKWKITETSNPCVQSHATLRAMTKSHASPLRSAGDVDHASASTCRI